MTGPAPDAEIFISPRVIDRTAFESYAEALRAIIADAGERAGALRGAAGEVHRLREGLREATGELGTRVDRASKLVPVLEDRAKRAEAALARVGDHEALAREIDALVEARVRERIESRLAEIEARLDARGAEGARAIESREREARERLEKSITIARDSVAQALTDIERRLQGLHDGPGGAIERVRTQAAPIIAQADGLLAELAQRSAEGAASMDAARERCEQSAAALAHLCERAEAASDPARINAAQTRAQESLAHAESASRTLASLIEQGELARQQLADAIATGAERIDESAARASEIAERAAALDGQIRGLDERARRATQESEQRAQTLVREIESRWQTLAREAERASMWVGGLIDQARQEQQRMTQGLAQQHAMLERMERLVRELEPWREFVAGGGTGGQLGARLDDLVHRTRHELGGQLTQAAAALQELAQRASSFGSVREGAGPANVTVPSGTPSAHGAPGGLYDDAHLRRPT
jgi:chromosome segregation ATPase